MPNEQTMKTNKSTKQAAVSTRKTLTHAQRSQIARLAALKAHTHKSFQSERNASERKQAVANFRKALSSAPKFVRESVAA